MKKHILPFETRVGNVMPFVKTFIVSRYIEAQAALMTFLGADR